MVRTYDLSIWETEAGECQFWGEPRISHDTPQTGKKASLNVIFVDDHDYFGVYIVYLEDHT